MQQSVKYPAAGNFQVNAQARPFGSLPAGIKNDICRLVEKSGKVYVSSVDEDGCPNTKAMFARDNDGMKVHYMSTNCSSLRVSQFRKNPKACIYYCNERFFKGLMFTGTMEVCTDREIRERIWRRGDEIYYPEGVDDEDYCVLRFTAEKGNYYHNLTKEIFSLEELEEAWEV